MRFWIMVSAMLISYAINPEITLPKPMIIPAIITFHMGWILDAIEIIKKW